MRRLQMGGAGREAVRSGPLGDRIGVRSVKRNDLSRKCGIVCCTRYDCRCE